MAAVGSPARAARFKGGAQPYIAQQRRNTRILQASLLASDALLIPACLIVAFWLRLRSGLIPTQHYDLGVNHAWTVAGITFLLVYDMRNRGLYEPSSLHSRWGSILPLIQSIAYTIVVLVAFTFMTKTEFFTERRLVIGFSAIFLLGVLGSSRVFLFWRLKEALLRPPRVLLIGPQESVRELLHRIQPMSEDGSFTLAGILETRGIPESSIEGVEVLGTAADLEDVVAAREISEVFISDLSIRHTELLGLVERCKRMGLSIRIISEVFESIASKLRLQFVDGMPIIHLRETPLRGLNVFLKRACDVVGSLLLLVLVSPLLVVIALLIKFSSRGPVLFVQRRVGRSGSPFPMLKFRSMYANSDDTAHREYLSRLIGGSVETANDDGKGGVIHKMADDRRVTAVGRFLRATSLDELPQLFNVLRGDMSLVGPRPAISYEVDFYHDWHRKRLSVLPGITGLWQVSGRSRLNFDQMVLLDIYYIENWSLLVDLKILFKTIPAVLFERSGC